MRSIIDLGRIAALHELAATARAPRAFGGIEQGLDDRGGQSARLLRRDEPAGLARPDDVGRAAHGSGHDGALECERLERGERAVLRGARGARRDPRAAR